MTNPPYPIREIRGDEFDHWYRAATAAFHHVPPVPEALETRRRITELGRTLAALDGERIAGTAAACSFRMSVPGATLPVAGVTEVTVSAAYRRRGVLRSLMSRQLTDVRERTDEPVAALFASETSIYGRFGYSRAAREISLSIGRGEGRFVPRAPAVEGLGLRIVEPEQVRPELARLYGRAESARPGMFARNDAWWDKRLLDPEQTRGSFGAMQCLLVEDEEEALGYALFAVRDYWDADGIPDNELHVIELFAGDPGVYAALWRHLLDRDLVGTICAPSRPLDDPLLRLLADPRRARTRLTDNLWIRLVDLGPALAGRRYARPVDLVLNVTDQFCPWNTGRWRISGDGAGTTCEPTRDPADVTLDIADLAGAYLGGGSFADAASAGLVQEHTPGALLTLSAAMHWDPQPWCPMVF